MDMYLHRFRLRLQQQWNTAARGLATVFLVLVGVSLWSGIIARVAQYGADIAGIDVPLLLVSGVTAVFGVGAASIVYAQYRGYTPGLSIPRGDSWLMSLSLVIAPLLIVALVSVVGNTVLGVSLSAMIHRWISPDISLQVFVIHILPPAVFLGFGYGILVCGVVVESIRDLVADEDVTWISALVIGFFWLLPIEGVASLPVSLGSAYELIVTIVFGIAFGLALGSFYGVYRAGGDRTALTRRHLAVFAVAGLGVFGIATGLTNVSTIIKSALWVFVLSLSVVGYQRSRSTWVAVLIITVFMIALRVVTYIEAALGVATM